MSAIGRAYWANIMAPTVPDRLRFVPSEIASDRDIRRQFVEEVIKPLRQGMYVEPGMLPTRSTAFVEVGEEEKFDQDGQRLTPCFFAADLIYVAAEARSVLERFDLGSGYFNPISLFEKDDQTRIEEEVFLFVPANRKNSCLYFGEEVYQSAGHSDPSKLHFASGFFGDNAAFLDVGAKRGPDIWVEERFFGALFFSAPVQQALSETGIARAFEFREAPILDD